VSVAFLFSDAGKFVHVIKQSFTGFLRKGRGFWKPLFKIKLAPILIFGVQFLLWNFVIFSPQVVNATLVAPVQEWPHPCDRIRCFFSALKMESLKIPSSREMQNCIDANSVLGNENQKSVFGVTLALITGDKIATNNADNSSDDRDQTVNLDFGLHILCLGFGVLAVGIFLNARDWFWDFIFWVRRWNDSKKMIEIAAK
jgi:hypothetical protein